MKRFNSKHTQKSTNLNVSCVEILNNMFFGGGAI